jgi:signal transduction histidine kinase
MMKSINERNANYRPSSIMNTLIEIPTIGQISDPLWQHEADLVAMLFDRVPMGIAILDKEYRVLRYNPTWAGFVARYSPLHAADLAPGVSLFELAPGFARDAIPLLNQALRGEVVRREALRLESEGVESCWDVVLMPLSTKGEIRAIVLMTTDATERVVAQRELEERVEERTREIEQRRRVAEGLRDILAVLNSNRPLQETLEYIAAEAGELLGTDSVAIFRLDPDSSLLMVQAACGLSPDYVANIAIPMGQGVVGRAVECRAPMASSDTRPIFTALTDSRRPGNDMLTWQLILARMSDEFHSILAVPLAIKDEIYGGLSLYYRHERSFSQDDLELAAMFGGQAALAIENARLREHISQTAVAAERNRLARDLHDSVTQTLFSASLIAEVLPRLWEQDLEEGRARLEELRQLTRGALAEMRMLLFELRPSSLTDVPLGELLRQLAEATSGRARVPVALTVEGERPIPAEAQVALYRIAQEALNNVARHSNASHARVHLRFTPMRVHLQVSDNGRGFNPARVPADHLGLKIMRERAQSIGARLNIKSRPGTGSRIAVSWTQIGRRRNGHERTG